MSRRAHCYYRVQRKLRYFCFTSNFSRPRNVRLYLQKSEIPKFLEIFEILKSLKIDEDYFDTIIKAGQATLYALKNAHAHVPIYRVIHATYTPEITLKLCA